MRKKILVVDDDLALNHLLRQYLHSKGFQALSATSGQEGFDLAVETYPNLVILDVMLPDIDGWQICKRLREAFDIPIIMLTALATESDVVCGFYLGADDYLTKPFSLKELEMRVLARLRSGTRRQCQFAGLYNDGILNIDLDREQVFVHGQPMHLTPTEFRLLVCLVRHEGCPVSREHLLEYVWGPATKTLSCLSMYIGYLRSKLENATQHQYIRTEWGNGYTFVPPNGHQVSSD
ncbi:MAG: response regulator transcription factor [Anaerolineae bacterium]|nr:response regulator transcription factor [Anaerolineae bacterium]